MRDHHRRCTRKRIVDPENPCGAKTYFDGCVDRWEKDETYREQIVLNGHTKAELQSWDNKMGEELVEHAYNQPYRLREQVQLGRLKISQHTEYQLAVKIVKEREHQGAHNLIFDVIERKFRRDSQRILPRLVCHL